jgi:hypothetical protein
MSIPDVTLTTACFNLSRFHGGCLDIDAILRRIEGVLQLPVYLVIYTEPALHAHIKEKRAAHGLDHLTHYVVTEFEALWAYQYTPIVKANRAVYWPSKDERTCAESHLLVLNKADFVLQTIQADPFKTSKFAWIDALLSVKNSLIHICEDYDISKILYALNNITDKFHIQVLNVNDKRFKRAEHKREYYQQYRYVVCGGFFTTGRTIGVKVLERVKQLAVETTHAGYGHGEEMLFLEILDEFYDDIHRSYGDYSQIINNFIQPTRNLGYVYDMIVARYMNAGYNRECYDAASALVRSFESYQIPMDWILYAKALFAAYIGAYYSQPPQVTLDLARRINDIYSQNPFFKAAYNSADGNRGPFYDSQLQYAEYLRPHYRVVACVFGCPTIDRYKAEVKKIEETWGVRIKTVFFFGEERTADFTGADHVYLPKVGNDHQSASYKQHLGLKYIYENYNADFVYVCGTDTYVNVSNLTSYIANMDPAKPTYIGGHGATVDVGPESVYYHSGGAGFLLSRAALRMLYRDLGCMTDRWLKHCDVVGTWYFKPACDLAIAYYLQKMGGCVIMKSPHFLACNHRGYALNYTKKCCGTAGIPPIKDIIACHFMNLLDFDEMEEILGAA